MATADEIKNRLGEFDDMYDKSPTAGSDDNLLPPDDGDYQLAITGHKVIATKSNDLKLKVELAVVGPKNAGWPCSVWYDLTQPEKLKYVKAYAAHVHDLGDVPLSDLPEALETSRFKYVDGTVVTSEKTDREGNPYRNLYLNKGIDLDPAEAAPAEDDIPF